ncbi:hypothetical protein M422DRAFT_275199 [Sphaerobolus stellatus SS14]|uniref:Uncharacterized protein n=1 Tax=Sphaerobolus stellatus (strain SS14) TaxID=990650 RepID=A0A0C9UF52_SPHS4|nr:hypothetical protein M422DRAFT_275199 [Sphaerobolus stellatus SS14]
MFPSEAFKNDFSCSSTDYIVIDGLEYPSTFPANYTIYNFNATCLRNGAGFCQANGTTYAAATLANAGVAGDSGLPDSFVCDTCFLQSAQLQLTSSSYGFNSDLASNRTEIMSRFYTSLPSIVPTQIIKPPRLPANAPVAPQTDTSRCGQWHVVVENDICNKLSVEYGTTFADL